MEKLNDLDYDEATQNTLFIVYKSIFKLTPRSSSALTTLDDKESRRISTGGEKEEAGSRPSREKGRSIRVGSRLLCSFLFFIHSPSSFSFFFALVGLALLRFGSQGFLKCMACTWPTLLDAWAKGSPPVDSHVAPAQLQWSIIPLYPYDPIAWVTVVQRRKHYLPPPSSTVVAGREQERVHTQINITLVSCGQAVRII